MKRPSKSTWTKDGTLAIRWPIGITSEESDDSKKFKISERIKTVAQISKTFVEELQKEIVNGALKLLTDNMDHRILLLNDDPISKLKTKHPLVSAPDPITLLPNEAQNIHPIRYDV